MYRPPVPPASPLAVQSATPLEFQPPAAALVFQPPVSPLKFQPPVSPLDVQSTTSLLDIQGPAASLLDVQGPAESLLDVQSVSSMGAQPEATSLGVQPLLSSLEEATSNGHGPETVLQQHEVTLCNLERQFTQTVTLDECRGLYSAVEQLEMNGIDAVVLGDLLRTKYKTIRSKMITRCDELLCKLDEKMKDAVYVEQEGQEVDQAQVLDEVSLPTSPTAFSFMTTTSSLSPTSSAASPASPSGTSGFSFLN